MLPFVSTNNDASILVSDLSSQQCEEFDQDPPEPDGGLGGGAAAEPFSLFLVVPASWNMWKGHMHHLSASVRTSGELIR